MHTNYTAICYITKLDDHNNPQIESVLDRLTVIAEDFDIPIFDYQDITTSEDPDILFGLTSNALVVSIGGDGTMLYAMRIAARTGAKVIGINLGKLGFLADTMLADVDAFVRDVFTVNDVILDERSLIMLDDGTEHLAAVNEYLIHGEDFSTFFSCKVYVDGRYISELNGSGVAISTPTGSTAYAVGLGGNIMMPSLDAFMIIPFAPHTLTARPVVVSGDSKIEIHTTLTNRSPQANILSDGQKILTKNRTSDDRDKTVVFKFSKYKNKAKIIHRKDWNFFDVLSEKMKW